MSARILVVDDEQSMREFLCIFLSKEGHQATAAASFKEASEVLASQEFELVLSDLRLGDGSGLDVLRASKEQHPETQVVILTAHATMENAVEAMRLGAYDYQLKPFKVAELRAVVQKALEKNDLIRENQALKHELEARTGLDALVGKSEAMRHVFSLIEKVAKAKTNVMVLGESGTGKELAARAIHRLSERGKKSFVAVNCGAIPEALMESELFGHVKGAFTGAHADKAGLFEAASGGTLFLDEIGELPMNMQVKLLRALQERSVKKVGSNAQIAVDVRVVAATNRDLEAEVKAGRFREDLYYRLNVIQIRLPPLRERREDIALLIEHFVGRIAAEQEKKIEGFTSDALKALLDYRFPGNVRELENIVERAVTLADEPLMPPGVLPPNVVPADAAPMRALHVGDDGISLEATLDAIEHRLLTEALEKAGGVKKKAAKLLGLTFRSLRYRLQKHGLSGKDDDAIDDGDEG